MTSLKETADIFYKNKQYDDALKVYTQILDEDLEETDSSIYVKLAIVQRFLKKYDDSERTIKSGLKKFPNNNGLLIEYAALENIRQNWDNALKLWKKVKSQSKDFSSLNYNRYARACEGANDIERLQRIINEGYTKYSNDKELIIFKKKYIKLKIAIQFYGHSRSFRDTFESFKKYILDVNLSQNILIDVFIHTWDEREHSILKPHYKKDEKLAGRKLTKNDINFIEKKYRPKLLKIDKQLSISDEDKSKIISNGFNPDNYDIINNISYTMYEANKLRESFTETYDFVLMTRLDIIFHKPLSFLDLVTDKIKPFMNFSNEELKKSIFYPYMETPNIYRNQKRYITGIDLLMFGKPNVLNNITKWHETVLSRNPQGTENALTRQINENNISYHLLYYPKPECWNILRTNDINLEKKSKIIIQKELWNYDAVKIYYEESLKSSNATLSEYIIFLADTGQLNILYSLIQRYGFDYLEKLPKTKYNHIYMLNFYKKEFIPALDSKNNKTIESNIIYLTINKDKIYELQNYLLENIKIFEKDNGKTQMYLNFAINALMKNNLFSIEMALKVIDLYTENCTVNKQRKKYLISAIIDYFEKIGKREFFNYLGIKGHHIQKISSVIHRYGDNEVGAKNYLKKFQRLVKNSSVKYNKSKSNPKIAVCISGMFRGDAKSVFELISKSIVEPLNADVFIHTWDERHDWMGIGGDINWVYRQFGGTVLSQCPEELKLKPFMEKNFPNSFKKLSMPDVKKMDINYLNRLISSKKYLIENQDEFLDKLNFSKNNLKTRGNFNQAKMLYGIYKSVEMMKNYEQENNLKYDYIIRCRPDIGLNNSLELSDLNKLEEDEVLVDFFPYGPQDQFRAGRRESMIKLANIWEAILEKQSLSPFEGYPNIDAHDLIFLWMIENGIISHPSNIKRDVSMGARGSKMPNISDELKIDLKKIDLKYRNREDFKSFFKLLMEL